MNNESLFIQVKYEYLIGDSLIRVRFFSLRWLWHLSNVGTENLYGDDKCESC